MPRAVPFVRLIVVAHGLRIEILSQYHRKQVVVQLVGDVRYQEFATEGKKRLQRTEVDAERGSPRREIPRAKRHRNQVSKALCGDAPIGEAAKGERDAQAARNHVGNDTRKGLLAHLQVAEKISSLCRAEAGNGNGKKAIACQWGEFGLLIEPGDERSTTEEEQIGARADKQAAPEYGVVVFVPDVPHVHQCRPESAFLQRVSDESKDSEHPHHSIFIGRKDACQDNPEQEHKHLLGTIVNGSPEESFGCLFF